MLISLNFSSQSLKLPKVLYYPATLKKCGSIGYFVQYSVYNPDTAKMDRKVIKLNRVREQYSTLREFKAYVKELIASINVSLQQFSLVKFENVIASPGVSSSADETPTVQTTTANPQKKHAVKDSIKNFINEKEKELREDSMRSYRSFTRIFKEWCSRQGVKFIEDCSHSTAAEFMDYVYNGRNVSAVSYNNYLKLGRAFWSWLLDKCHHTFNIFEKIKKKRPEEKHRVLITPEDRKQLLSATNIRQNYATLCMLVYSSLIRPNEIRQIQIKHIHLDESYIEIPGENAKNHKTRYSALTPQLVARLRELHLDRYPLDYYLFGFCIEPSAKQAAKKTYTDYFDTVRTKLNWNKNYTLYSFRDTGITEMLQSGIPNIDVMKHADHSSLDVTTIYTKHQDNSLIEKIASRAPEF